MSPRIARTVALSAVAAVLLSGCAPEAGSSADEPTTVTFRLWDETVAESYEQSFDAFEEEHPDIDVQVNVVGWEDYWTDLRTDVADQTMDDLFWVNNSYYGAYADAGSLVNIDETLGEAAKDAWEPSVVDQFTRDETLWGVPQLYDAGIAVYYNTELLEAAGLTPEDLEDLTWSPDPEDDTYTAAAKALTLDSSGRAAGAEGFDAGAVSQYGTNLAYDLQAIMLPFIGSNGGQFQDGEDFAFADDEKTVEAISYLVSKIRSDHVAPDPADTNEDGDFSRDAFIDGKMAMFQSGIYNLKNVQDGADFDWGVSMIPSGPAGRVSVTNGVVVAGNAASEKQDAIADVLEWLGSEEGAAPLGESGTAVPGVTDAQSTFFDYWENEGVDVEPFFDVVGDTTIPAPTGPDFAKAFDEYDPILRSIFTGDVTVEDGLRQAQDAANTALAG
ncbi:carbohydrate ABC transporter substrate-binding protein (CUT1 family) [Labedella gwakjiensis]|uniref:Carbohydrate ABC transporter substrate-binding protein (CUT1 family) n=1 Tax=Labedella gwakjiensis TaxID=390269 RepID=A0A2P8GTF1_9MICO|nr:sugar ABC transporter substrate-binding protein [Labedella gwakjiensis]PSL37243.1 carbohydrate ABC transporter substrate-binding protein (CUT1 family) [Labedella gwakjiensis]RUQ84576.1 sugar ABC transporter substrate-binding protein [Labedella gwakjiensis]